MGSKISGLDMTELKAIVKLCVKNKIKSLKWQDLVLEFGADNTAGDFISPQPRTKPVKAITGEEQRAQTQAGLEEDELTLREQQIADLQITDPRAAEEMIVNGELDDTTGDDDTE